MDICSIFILAAPRNDDSENIVSFLVFVIIMVIGLIANIAKARSEAAQKGGRGKQQTPRQPALSRRREGTTNSLTAGQDGTRGQSDQAVRETALNPVSLRYTGETVASDSERDVALVGLGQEWKDWPKKSSLDRFIELKGVDVSRPRPLPADVSHPTKQFDTTLFSELEGIGGEVELIDVEPAELTSTEEGIFDLSLDRVAQAVIFREILDKPLALRDRL